MKHILKTKFPHIDAYGNGDILYAGCKVGLKTIHIGVTVAAIEGFYRFHFEIPKQTKYHCEDFPMDKKGLSAAKELFDDALKIHKESFKINTTINNIQSELERLDALKKK